MQRQIAFEEAGSRFFLLRVSPPSIFPVSSQLGAVPVPLEVRDYERPFRPDQQTQSGSRRPVRYRTRVGRGWNGHRLPRADLRHQRNVALKVLKPELAAVIGAEWFLAEIQTTANPSNLQHPHILPLFDSGEEDGFLYYVMPYVEGESLRERIDREKQLPVLREWENSRYQYERGLFTPEEFEARLVRWQVTMTQPGFREVWEGSREFYAPSFRAEIDRIVAEVGG